jgi:transforming growth factor-beta-induced protein
MKKFTSLLVSLIVLSLTLAACAPAATPMPEPTATPMPMPTATPMPEPTEAPKTIVDIAVADGRFKTLVQAVQAAGLAETLSGQGPFTVFAPTDDAFAKLPAGTLEALLADPEQLKNILLYHVVAGKVMSDQAKSLSEAEMLNGEKVSIKAEMDKLMINDSQVVLADIEASNGVIHVIDTVLLPPQKATIVDIAKEDGRFTTLLSAVEAAGLVDTLNSEGPFTVFAPTDEAFAKLPAGTIEALLQDIPQLSSILLYHVVPGKLMAADVTAADYLNTAQGESVRIKVEDGKAYINEAQIILTDIEAANGVIHVIDTVILPGKTIADVAVNDGRFSTLVTALQAANLVETLQGEGPFTVFAPTDDAFAKLPAGTIESLLKDIPTLKNILLYHVVSGAVKSDQVVTLTSADTVAGKPVTVKVEDGKVFINNAQVVIVDIVAKNGIIHVIDTVLLPE